MRDAASGEAGPRKDWPDATRLQVPGVAFFVFNDRFPVSGAHPPQTLLEVMQAAVQVMAPAEPAASPELVP